MKNLKVVHSYDNGVVKVVKLSDGSEVVGKDYTRLHETMQRIIKGEFKHLKVLKC